MMNSDKWEFSSCYNSDPMKSDHLIFPHVERQKWLVISIHHKPNWFCHVE